ncbi:hypothetical protein [Kribbella sp. NPDC000426]|uniref:hypothetical protein n=1 Tax=Kribbella sp. NPDC000426 TaxID=3154255 RepID=UPI00331C46A4
MPDPIRLDDHAVMTVASISRAMYPHDTLPDEVYARVAAKLADAAGEDAATAAVISTALSTLTANDHLLELPEEVRLTTVASEAGTEFFNLVRSLAVVEVYSDTRTWELCGYEGPSFDKGGYLTRGFNDLDWLPDPEDEP